MTSNPLLSRLSKCSKMCVSEPSSCVQTVQSYRSLVFHWLVFWMFGWFWLLSCAVAVTKRFLRDFIFIDSSCAGFPFAVGRISYSLTLKLSKHKQRFFLPVVLPLPPGVEVFWRRCRKLPKFSPTVTVLRSSQNFSRAPEFPNFSHTGLRSSREFLSYCSGASVIFSHNSKFSHTVFRSSGNFLTWCLR